MVFDKIPILSITRKDLEIQTFRSGGKGGQHQNKTESGVRIVHKESGANGESRTERSQYQNRKIALQHLIKNAKFKVWLNRRLFEIGKRESLDSLVDKEMVSEKLKIEVHDENNKWIEYKEDNKCLNMQ